MSPIYPDTTLTGRNAYYEQIGLSSEVIHALPGTKPNPSPKNPIPFPVNTHAAVEGLITAVVEVLFAGHTVCRLLYDDKKCVCGELSGDAIEPESHASELCPVAGFYAAVRAMEGGPDE
jgi:hypothetical protein